jgi:hypothetical protein
MISLFKTRNSKCKIINQKFFLRGLVAAIEFSGRFWLFTFFCAKIAKIA